MNKKLSYR